MGLLVRVGESFSPFSGSTHFLSNPPPPPAGRAAPRLKGKTHPRRDRFVSDVRIQLGPPPRDSGILMDFDTQPMSGAVPECLAQPMLAERVPRRCIDVESRPARSDGRNRAIVRLANGVVDVASPSVGSTDRYSPGQVDAV